VICLDELGPLAVKTYPGESYVPHGRRATYEPDYGRRGKLWVHGAFEPATGEAALTFSTRRDSASHIALLEQVVTLFPSDRLLLIADNLSTHHSRDTHAALLAWPDVRLQFLPTAAAWLNLIEPWWKVLKALALKGRRFETVAELEAAFRAALAYWTAHRHPFTWHKRPKDQPTPVLSACTTGSAISVP
jgi:transposase